ncbi:PH domain-like protein [Auriscalpium vulgare]|uniref:PH domain-like protein n=1 Tax=Auriscalpium vulgare TaxID=40419 RepID=A0ACB8S8M7_9AGAM|nr:PH domain-like protein [Auriscalpium vulgare]
MSSPRPPSVAPPTPQEVHRKLSIHGAVKPKISASGTESDSDSHSLFAADTAHAPYVHPATPHMHAPEAASALSAIAEQRSHGEGEESEDEYEHEAEHEHEHEHEAERAQGAAGKDGAAKGLSDIKAGYLWKKGERRKTWKRRWFVLRPGHLAYYKTSAEYQLHRLLDLGDVHTCTAVALKKHTHAFGVVCAARTFYLQAESADAVRAWVRAIKDAKAAMASSSSSSVRAGAGTSPIPIPASVSRREAAASASASASWGVTPSPPTHVFHGHGVTSSESEDALPPTPRLGPSTSTSAPGGVGASPGGAGKVVVSGYIMKLGKRRNWRKRWFVLNGEKLMYSGSHMDTKAHREIALSQILDAFEYELGAKGGGTGAVSPPGTEGEEAGTHTFKIVTTKRTLVLCAPSEEEEIRWLSAVRALLARRGAEGAGAGGALGGAVDERV